MKHLFQSWQEFVDAAGAVSHILFLSDYDGTLTPIVSRPEEALLTENVREKMRVLAEKPDYSVGIISGRAIAEIRAMVGLEGIYYAGNHGLEIEGPGLRFVSEPAQAAQSLMKGLAGEMAAALENISGVIIQDKGLSISVHYRLVVPEEENDVAGVFRRLTKPLLDEGKIKVTSGKKVFEVRPPVDWHKGRAVQTIIREIKSTLNLDSVLALYLGDDTTDEDAFKVLQEPEGWSVFIGGDNPLSSAEYYLDSTMEVAELLDRLMELK